MRRTADAPLSGKVQKCPKSSVSTRKLFLTMGNMFLGSEMMFDMIRNYFRVESDDFDDFGFLPLRGRFDDALTTGTPLPWGGEGVHADDLAVRPPPVEGRP